MITASKRADPGRSTLSIGALAGASMSNLGQEMTMTTNITTRPPGATEDMTLVVNDLTADTVTLKLFEDRSRPLNPGEPIKFSTSLDDQPVVTRSAVPLYDSCRVLAAFGFTGKVEFVNADGIVAMTMEIERGAQLTVAEGPHGPRVRKHVSMRAGPVASGRNDQVAAIDRAEA